MVGLMWERSSVTCENNAANINYFAKFNRRTYSQIFIQVGGRPGSGNKCEVSKLDWWCSEFRTCCNGTSLTGTASQTVSNYSLDGTGVLSRKGWERRCGSQTFLQADPSLPINLDTLWVVRFLAASHTQSHLNCSDSCSHQSASPVRNCYKKPWELVSSRNVTSDAL